jgi:hypothetical protein
MVRRLGFARHFYDGMQRRNVTYGRSRHIGWLSYTTSMTERNKGGIGDAILIRLPPRLRSAMYAPFAHSCSTTGVDRVPRQLQPAPSSRHRQAQKQPTRQGAGSP